MSKISEYQERLRQATAERERQSVADFASELKKTPEALLMQLRDAGVMKASVDDVLTLKDKHSLLTHLQGASSSKPKRKKIVLTTESHEKKLARSVAQQVNGAEFEVLQEFAGSVIFGDSINPNLQSLVNLIVAKAVLVGAMPPAKLGRPKRDELDAIGLQAAQLYWEMIDSGIGYQEAVDTVSGKFHKSERHIMRLIANHKNAVGDTLEERTGKRKWYEIMRDMYKEHPGALDRFKAMIEPKIPFPDLELGDYLEHLEEQVQELAASIKPLTIKT